MVNSLKLFQQVFTAGLKENWNRVALVYRLRECHLKYTSLQKKIKNFKRASLLTKGHHQSEFWRGGGKYPAPPPGGAGPALYAPGDDKIYGQPGSLSGPQSLGGRFVEPL